MKKTNCKWLGLHNLALIFSLFTLVGFAQKSILERTISINIKQQKFELALKSIALQGKFNFSYNADMINIDSLVSISETDQSIRQILDKLLGEKIKFKEKGNFIILQKSMPVVRATPPKKAVYTISGYIIDQASGNKIPYASLYQETTLEAAISNQYGYYQLQLASSVQPTIQLNIRKENYVDTLIILRPLENSKLDISIKPIVKKNEIDSILLPLDTLGNVQPALEIEENKFANFLISAKQKFQSANLKQYFNKGWQVSLVPGLSTNGILNSNIVNDYSFNVIGGYSGGTNKLEVGGFVNIDRTNVNGLQIAGFSNLVGGKVEGVQMAGFSNTNLKSVKGAQFAGFCNIITDTLKGIQLAGFCNVIKGYTTGLQASGFCNIVTSKMNGLQLAGFANVTLNDLNNFQLAGFANYSKNTKGIQAAGFMNITAKKMGGFQVSGFLNYASEMTGVQLGFINLSKKAEGIPIGFLSFAGNGFHKFEFAANDITPFNLSFKTGVRQFYNIFSAGYGSYSDIKIFIYGYGLGHEFTLNKKLGLDLEVISNQVNLKKWNRLNLWNKVNFNTAWNLTPHFNLFAGPSLNYLITEKINASQKNEFTENYIPLNTRLFQSDFSNFKSTAWVGFNVGVRIW